MIVRAFLVVFLLAGLAGCKHLLKVPDVGGNIRIGHETKPTGPIITSETQSGAACGPNLPACPGTTGCFVVKDKPVCTTEDAACAAAGCGSKPCQIQESYPMRAVCR